MAASAFDSVFGDIFPEDVEVTAAPTPKKEVAYSYEDLTPSTIYPDCSCMVRKACEVFPELTGNETPVTTYHWDTAPPIAIPEVDPYYVPDAKVLSTIITAGHLKLKLMTIGDTGTGKTSLLEYFAAKTGRPFVRQQFDNNLDDQKLFGCLEFDEKGTYFNKSLMVKSFDYPTVCVFDEFTRATSEITMLANPVLDRGTVTVTAKDGECAVAQTSEDFLIFGTDNTAGNGDGMDIYNSSNVVDEAIRNRFDLYEHMDYPPKSVVTDIVERMSDGHLTDDEMTKIVAFTLLVQKGFKERTITTAWSTRNLKAIIPLVKVGYELKDAVEVNYLNRILESERADVEETMRVVFH